LKVIAVKQRANLKKDYYQKDKKNNIKGISRYFSDFSAAFISVKSFSCTNSNS